MPPNSVYIGRSRGVFGKWGNPLLFSGDTIYIDAGYRRTIFSPWVILLENTTLDRMLYIYRRLWSKERFSNPDLQYWSDKFKRLDLSELKGKDLVCWCALDKACHGDILIEMCLKLKQ